MTQTQKNWTQAECELFAESVRNSIPLEFKVQVFHGNTKEYGDFSFITISRDYYTVVDIHKPGDWTRFLAAIKLLAVEEKSEEQEEINTYWYCGYHKDTIVSARGNSYYCPKCKTTPESIFCTEDDRVS